jgi:hypothetical protein
LVAGFILAITEFIPVGDFNLDEKNSRYFFLGSSKKQPFKTDLKGC